MFESNFLERFSRAHPLTPAIMYLPVVVWATRLALRRQPTTSVVLGVVEGYFLWTLVEYWLHRLIFHFSPVGPRTARIAFLIHGVHHETPADQTRLVFPPAASLGLCVLTYAIFRSIMGATRMWAPFAGFVLGYVIYDEVHWYLHVGKPKGRPWRWLRRQHFLHHFSNPATRFGVSCPWLDYVFQSRGAGRIDASPRPPQ